MAITTMEAVVNLWITYHWIANLMLMENALVVRRWTELRLIYLMDWLVVHQEIMLVLQQIVSQ